MEPTVDNPYEYVMLSKKAQSRPHQAYKPFKDTNENREIDIYAEPVNLYEDVQNTLLSVPARDHHTNRRPSIPLPDIPREMKALGRDTSHQRLRTKRKSSIGPKLSGVTMNYETKTRTSTPTVAGHCDGATGNTVHQVIDGCSLQAASFTSLQEIPEDISHLSVGQMGDCLRLLQMEYHVEDFKRKQIDGKLLVTIDAFMLQQEFGMSLFHANKLMQFCQGWRPVE